MYNSNLLLGVRNLYGLIEHTDEINRLLARYGVKFGIYKNNVFNEFINYLLIFVLSS